MSLNLSDPAGSTRNAQNTNITQLSSPGQPLLTNVQVQTGNATRPQLPPLSIDATLEFWAEDPVIALTMKGRTLLEERERLRVQRSEGGEEVRIEEMPRRGEGLGELLGYYEDGTPFFDPH